MKRTYNQLIATFIYDIHPNCLNADVFHFDLEIRLLKFVQEFPGIHVTLRNTVRGVDSLPRRVSRIGFPDDDTLIRFKLMMPDGFDVKWFKDQNIVNETNWNYVIL